MFRDLVSPIVYERVIWNFMCGRVFPSVLHNLNVHSLSNEGKKMAIFICEDFINVLPSTPLYGNQQSRSRYEILSSLKSTITNLKENIDRESTILSFEKLLKETIPLGGGSVGSVAIRDVINKNAADAFLAMNASAML